MMADTWHVGAFPLHTCKLLPRYWRRGLSGASRENEGAALVRHSRPNCAVCRPSQYYKTIRGIHRLFTTRVLLGALVAPILSMPDQPLLVQWASSTGDLAKTLITERGEPQGPKWWCSLIAHGSLHKCRHRPTLAASETCRCSLPACLPYKKAGR